MDKTPLVASMYSFLEVRSYGSHCRKPTVQGKLSGLMHSKLPHSLKDRITSAASVSLAENWQRYSTSSLLALNSAIVAEDDGIACGTTRIYHMRRIVSLLFGACVECRAS